MIKKKNNGNLRDCTLPMEAVLKAETQPYDKKWTSIPSLGAFIDTDSLNLWKDKGVSCVICGITGSYFAKERTPGNGSMYNRWHLNLYALDDKGFEVQMTKDHITAKAQGGPEFGTDNLQPMCYPHNQKKAAKPMDEFMEKVKNNEGILGEVWDEKLGKPIQKKSEARIKAEQHWEKSTQTCIDDIKEYYGLELSRVDLMQAVSAGHKIKQENTHVYLMDCIVGDKHVYVYYDHGQNTPFKACPPAPVEDIYKKMPSWLKTRPDKDTIAKEYEDILVSCRADVLKVAGLEKAEAAKIIRLNPAYTVTFAMIDGEAHWPSLNAWTTLMKKYHKKHDRHTTEKVTDGGWQPVFYWTGDLKKDAELINKPHIAEEGEKEDRTEETYDLIQTCIDYKHFELKDALNIQNKLISLNNWKGIVPGLRKHSINFKDSPKWEDVESEIEKLFPVRMTGKEKLLQWYKDAATVHPFSDLNGRVLGIIVAVLNYNAKKNNQRSLAGAKLATKRATLLKSASDAVLSSGPTDTIPQTSSVPPSPSDQHGSVGASSESSLTA